MRTLPGSASDVGGDRQRQRSIANMLLQTRLFALGTLSNIAHTPPPQKLRLCTTQDGMLLTLLCNTVSSREEDSSIRDKTFAVIFNLLSIETAQLLVTHARLLDCLVEAASTPGTNTPESAGTMAFRSLNALSQVVTSRGLEEYQVLVRRAIDQVNVSRRFHDMAVPLESSSPEPEPS